MEPFCVVMQAPQVKEIARRTCAFVLSARLTRWHGRHVRQDSLSNRWQRADTGQRRAGCSWDGLALGFFCDIALDRVNENEFLAAGAFVVEPSPFQGSFLAKVVDFLDGAGDQFRRVHHAHPGGGPFQAQMNFRIIGRGGHVDEPQLSENG